MCGPSTEIQATIGPDELRSLSCGAGLLRRHHDIAALFLQLPGLDTDGRRRLERICALANENSGIDAEIWFRADRTLVHLSR